MYWFKNIIINPCVNLKLNQPFFTSLVDGSSTALSQLLILVFGLPPFSDFFKKEKTLDTLKAFLFFLPWIFSLRCEKSGSSICACFSSSTLSSSLLSSMPSRLALFYPKLAEIISPYSIICSWLGKPAFFRSWSIKACCSLICLSFA